ncbi:MAG: peptide-methionine (S)-S-oxide reductase MsrA [Pseudomonadota bacterium]|nr:peptide-methionine (S)-S-oxide reductase MsrA [Pseudomonadota bacterium]
MLKTQRLERAILGSGCFWCTEAVFSALRGVRQVTSGYAGGASANPTYAQICTGLTGHAEVIAVDYDPEQIDYHTLLQVFFATHDPTTRNRQGNDIGTQYRSVIFYMDDQQCKIAQDLMEQMQQQGVAVVTELSPAPTFYPAEAYHQGYFEKNPTQGYCNALIPPKLNKLKQYFADYVAH